MRMTVLALVLTAAPSFALDPRRDATVPGESSIDAAQMRNDIAFLASDDNKGRDTGGGQLEGPVTAYLERIWQSLGIQPAGDAGRTTYRQPFQARRWNRMDAEMLHPTAHDSHGLPAGAFGHTPNQGGVAFDLSGHLATVNPLPPGLDMDQALEDEGTTTHNLVGIFPGSDPAKQDEYLVIGAHMDHIGSSSWGTGDKIYNGADDNGSGSSSVLAMCRALAEAKKQGKGPARSVLIILFSGEELGLLGSQYYCSNPTVPLQKIKGMLNIDMIGRLDANQVSVFDNAPSGQPNFFHGLHDTQGTGLTKIQHDIQHYLNRSDQYPFYRKGIPVTFFFEGFTQDGEMNPDYHGRGDHADKIEYTKLADITKFVFRHLMTAASLP